MEGQRYVRYGNRIPIIPCISVVEILEIYGVFSNRGTGQELWNQKCKNQNSVFSLKNAVLRQSNCRSHSESGPTDTLFKTVIFRVVE